MLMHALMLGSRANGPGLRAVVWCDLNHKMAASAVLYFLGAADSRNTAALSVG